MSSDSAVRTAGSGDSAGAEGAGVPRRTPGEKNGLVRLGYGDTLKAIGEVAAPTLAKGVVIRRPSMMALAQTWGLDDKAVARLQALRARHGTGPLQLSVPGPRQAVLLDPDHVREVLADTQLFPPASAQKKTILAHFEPKNALGSEFPERAERRRFNEDVLETERPRHSMSGRFARIVGEEIGGCLPPGRDTLAWDAFFEAWFRAVRRMVLGDGAADDHELTDMLAKLRGAANWGFLHPVRKKLRARYHARLNEHLDRAEAGSLAAAIAARPNRAETAPGHQVSQWFFAFDPAGMIVFRALAALSVNPRLQDRARAEASADIEAPHPFLRACMIDTIRLWATAPGILRGSSRAVRWKGGETEEGTQFLIYLPFFMRDDETLSVAHVFAPDLWPDGLPRDIAETGRQSPAGDARVPTLWPLLPFSGGPGLCPASHLVPLTGAMALAAILRRGKVTLAESPHRLDPQRLPGTLDQTKLTFRIA